VSANRDAPHASAREILIATAAPTLKFTIEQYDLMIDAGVFATPEATGGPSGQPPRVELIHGEIVMMSPIGPRHEEIVDRLTAWRFACVPPGVIRIRVQQSLGIPGHDSVPQPDVAWVQPRGYATERPHATDALLVIEVAESSVRYDLGEKAMLYASGGVPEYWVVDAAEQSIHVLRSPGMRGYGEHRVVGRGESITPLVAATAGLPHPSLAVEALFEPRP
jgi:Uma2 family endonuclease